MTKITTFLTNPYYADSDDIITNFVNENVEVVSCRLVEKGYTQEDGYWIDKSDPEDLRWVYIIPFGIQIEKLDDVI